MTLLRPLGIIFPGAVATISRWPKLAHISANTNAAITLAPIARPIGEGGVSTISSAAGKNSSSSGSRGLAPVGKGTIFAADFIRLSPNTGALLAHFGRKAPGILVISRIKRVSASISRRSVNFPSKIRINFEGSCAKLCPSFRYYASICANKFRNAE
jgi:hypothetical protein